MKVFYRYAFLLLMLFVFPLAACAPQQTIRPGENIGLAAFTDTVNQVGVTIRLGLGLHGEAMLIASFTPPAGYHLYSKDIPLGGVRGQGRPTLIELPPGSQMQAAGALTESAAAGLPGYNPDGPAVYPDGPVTLTLPVRLPNRSGWVEDQVSLTYMPCTALNCKTPVVGRLVAVRIPGALLVSP